MKRKKIISLFVIASLTLFGLVYTIAQDSIRKLVQGSTEQLAEESEKAAEVIGTPTGDDPWQEVEKLVNSYYDKQGIAYQGTMKLIDDNGTTEKVVEEKQFEYTMLGSNYYYVLGLVEVINKNDYILAVNHENKSVAVSPAGTASPNPGLFNIEEFKKLMIERKATAKVTQLDNVKILTIDNIEDPVIQGYRIYYTPETYRIHKMLIGMVRLSPLDEPENNEIENSDLSKEKASGTDAVAPAEGYAYYLEINFTNIKRLSLKPSEFKPEQKFIKLNGDRIELTTAYSSYRLIAGITSSKTIDE